MATYKIEIIKRLGKFHAALFPATSPKPNPTDFPGLDTLDDTIRSLKTEFDEKKIFAKDGSVIFRGIAYEDINSLTRQISSGKY